MSNTLCVSTKRCDPTAIDHEIRRLGGAAYGLVLTPRTCELCAWRKGCFDGNTELVDAFDIRAFCSKWEMRWIRDGSDGVITLMSESENAVPHGWDRRTEIRLASTLERRYLLWGRVDLCQPGTADWTTLSNGRTAPIRVPVATSDSATRIQLVAREYLAQFAHGNVCVFDQRLIAYRAIDASSVGAPKDDDDE